MPECREDPRAYVPTAIDAQPSDLHDTPPLNVFESIPDALVLVDGGGRIARVNAQTEHLFGYEPGELIGQSVDMLWPERAAGPPPATSGDGATAWADAAVEWETAGRRRDGGEFPIEVRWRPLIAEAEGHCLAVIRAWGRSPGQTGSPPSPDAVRRAAEGRAEDDVDFAESLIQTAQAVVLVVDPAGRIVRLNPYTEQLIGHRLEQVRGMDWTRLALTPAVRKQVGGFFHVPPEPGRLAHAVFPIIGRDETQHDIHWNGRALIDRSGRVTGLLFTGHDVTELHQTQRRLVQAERLAAIGQMAAGLAHESRNALQQIGACAEMLAMELVGQIDLAPRPDHQRRPPL